MWELGAYRPFRSSVLDAAPGEDTKFNGCKIERILPDVALTLLPCSHYGATRELGVFLDRPMAFLYAEETFALNPHDRLQRGPNTWTYPIYVCEDSTWMTGDEVLEVNRESLTHWAVVTLNDTLHVLASDRIGLQWQGGEVAGFYSDGSPLN